MSSWPPSDYPEDYDTRQPPDVDPFDTGTPEQEPIQTDDDLVFERLMRARQERGFHPPDSKYRAALAALEMRSWLLTAAQQITGVPTVDTIPADDEDLAEEILRIHRAYRDAPEPKPKQKPRARKTLLRLARMALCRGLERTRHLTDDEEVWDTGYPTTEIWLRDISDEFASKTTKDVFIKALAIWKQIADIRSMGSLRRSETDWRSMTSPEPEAKKRDDCWDDLAAIFEQAWGDGVGGQTWRLDWQREIKKDTKLKASFEEIEGIGRLYWQHTL